MPVCEPAVVAHLLTLVQHSALPVLPSPSDIEVDLTPYLTEPETQAATEVDVTCQTDEFEERPDTPDYVPKKTGIDASTQIEPDDLFSFDREVEPILEIIVGKTLEQALLEVEEETELQGIETRKVCVCVQGDPLSNNPQQATHATHLAPPGDAARR